MSTNAFIASVSHHEWASAYEKLQKIQRLERCTVHFGGPVLPPPNAGPKWKPEGFTVWVGTKYATAKTLGVAVDRAIRAYEGNGNAE